jgi:glycosyltransferase involved in cell wall biosynthesis
MEIVKDAVNVRSFLIPRGKLFSGGPRNKGIEEAKGEYIVYLDIDDIYGLDHLKIISEHLNGYDWVWYDDFRYNDKWYVDHCDIKQAGKCGTSNVCHKKILDARWDVRGYTHDYWFIQHLLKYKNCARIETPEYYVAHVPGNGRIKGYEL